MGPREGPPTKFAWQWYYHLPSLVFWGLVILPLVLVKENRCWRAWAILIPLVAILLIFRTIANLISLSPATTEGLGTPLATLATAWAIVWLLAPWLPPRHWVLAVVCALIVMLATGLLSYACSVGLEYSDILPTLVIYYAIASLGLLLPMAVSGRFCRKAYSPGAYMAWLLLWTVLTLMVGMFMFAIWTAFLASSLHILILAPIIVVVAGGVGGTVLYLLNLPFMLLAFGNSFYRARFCHVFGLQAAPERTLDETSPPFDPGSAATAAGDSVVSPSADS